MSSQFRNGNGENRIMNPSLYFICGALRSGSSVTHLMLNNHPRLKNPGEFDFLFDCLREDGEFPEIRSYREWLSTHRIFQSKSLEVDSSLSFSQLIKSFIAQLQEPDTLLSLNVHRNFDRIPYLFPDAKYIHLVRDPRDVARSSIGMGWAGNVYFGVDHWIETERSWLRLREKIRPDQFYEIKYEDLIRNPEQTLKDVCVFLELDYSDSMLDYADHSTYIKPDSSLVYQWKRKLSVKEIQWVESKVNDLMLSLGYESSGHPSLTVGFFDKLKLKVTNKIIRVSFSMKRYGVLLYLKDYLARALNWESLKKATQLKKNEIETKYLK